MKQSSDEGGVPLLLAPDAAAISGRIILPAGKNFSSLLYLYLFPTQPGEVLRSRRTLVSDDGRFSFTNLAPGTYHLLPLSFPSSAEAEANHPWNLDSGSLLRLSGDSVADGVLIELFPCQRVTNYELRYNGPLN